VAALTLAILPSLLRALLLIELLPFRVVHDVFPLPFTSGIGVVAGIDVDVFAHTLDLSSAACPLNNLAT
jgi:hypothetical protein